MRDLGKSPSRPSCSMCIIDTIRQRDPFDQRSVGRSPEIISRLTVKAMEPAVPVVAVRTQQAVESQAPLLQPLVVATQALALH